MEINIKLIILVVSILFTGLTAGLCFTWSNAVTPGIGRLDDLSFLQSFQAMNRAIINRNFLFVFFAPCILLFVNVYIFKNAAPITFWSFLAAAILYFAGIGLVTIFKNVPLNEILDKSELNSLSSQGLKELRKVFEKPWNRWHLVRTITSGIAFVLLIVGMLLKTKIHL